MKECNACANNKCRPSKEMVMSDLDCSQHTPIDRSWKLRYVISKISISAAGAMSDTLKWFLKWS